MKKEAERQADSVIFEGMTSFRAVIRSSVPDARKITRLMFDRAKERSKARELSFIRRMSAERGFEVVMCGADEINALATGTSHGGIIFECTERTIPTLCAGNIVGRDDGISDFFIMLDGIEDPYNFGYALRSVYAAGAAGVILPGRNWMSAAGVVCRSSAGASELLPMYTADSADACRIFHDAGYRVVCAGIRDSVPVWDAPLTPPLLLIVGGEKRGISAGVLEMADEIVRLDYGRDFSGSLSAASAASIIAYEVLRQNR